MQHLKLKVLDDQFTIHRFSSDSEIPSQIYESAFYSIIRTEDEVSIICSSSLQLNAEKSVGGWSCLKVIGPLDFSLTGILAGFSSSLSEAGISIFAVSTYDTDYILVRSEKLQHAKEALRAAGHMIME